MFTSILQLSFSILVIVFTCVFCYRAYLEQDKFFPITNWTKLPYSDSSYGTWIARHAFHDEIVHRGPPSEIDRNLGGYAVWNYEAADEKPAIRLASIRINDVAKPVDNPFRHLQYVEYRYKINDDLREKCSKVIYQFPGTTLKGNTLICKGAWAGQIQCMIYYCIQAAKKGQVSDVDMDKVLKEIGITVSNPSRGFELEARTIV